MNLGDSWWRSPAATQPLRDRSNQQPQLYEPLPLRLDSVDKRACFGTKRQYDSSNRQRAAEVLSGNESANSKRRRSTFTVPDQEITECCATRRCCTLLSAEALSRCRAAVRENSSSSAQRKQYALTLVVRQTSCSADQGVDHAMSSKSGVARIEGVLVCRGYLMQATGFGTTLISSCRGNACANSSPQAVRLVCPS